MILLVDNYDSFTFNLYQQVSRLGGETRVVKNDELTLEQIRGLNPEKIILSPGPKTPADSGQCIPIIRTFFRKLPVLGICLGHQCLGVAFGQRVVPAKRLMFGKTSSVLHSQSPLYEGLPASFEAARYHSLVIDDVPEGFIATSFETAGDIMSIEHESLPLFGLQFHPESFLMQAAGDRIIKNFLAI